MNQTVESYLEDFFKKAGIQENSLVNNMKKRNIRIQICMKGINLEQVGKEPLGNSELKNKLDSILDGLKVK
jgi:predicted SpoU family rRNA methylase